ncbi:MAG: O-antigen ligase family protein [Verrucomicrobia bacterium]|nr:O-antigen ligase family protein [Verrucomicrobiota bacterium]
MTLHLLRGAEGAYSATSIGTFAVGIMTFLALVWLRRHERLLSGAGLSALIVFLIGFGVAAPFLGGANVAGFSSGFGRNETLTGRTETWEALVPVVKNQPFLGVGFGSFWTTARRDFYQMSHGHNGYLDILLEVGAVGLAFYVALLLACAHKLQAALRDDYEWASLGISFLLMALVYNVTESALNSLAEQMTALVILVSLAVPARRVSQCEVWAGNFNEASALGSPAR